MFVSQSCDRVVAEPLYRGWPWGRGMLALSRLLWMARAAALFTQREWGMQDLVSTVRLRELAMKTGTEDVFPALKGRRERSIDPKTAAVRRELWRAFQRGGLSEAELASTLDRLEFASTSQHLL
jgi:hypothetical protein